MAPLPSTKQEEKLTTVTRLYNFWFHPNTGMEHVTQNRQSYLDSINKSTSADDSNVSSYIIFLYLMIAVDVLWFLHRFLKAVDMSRLLLIGYPLYFDCREKIGIKWMVKISIENITKLLWATIECMYLIYYASRIKSGGAFGMLKCPSGRPLFGAMKLCMCSMKPLYIWCIGVIYVPWTSSESSDLHLLFNVTPQ